MAAAPRTLSIELLDCLAGSALGVFELALAATFFAEIAAIQQLGFDLFERETAAGGVFRPGHIRAMKIAGIYRITVKLSERLDAQAVSAPAPLVRLLTLPCLAVAACLDAREELGRLRINAPGS